MKTEWIIAVLLIAATPVSAHSMPVEPHEFLQTECDMCHVDVKNDPEKILSFATAACVNCHSEVKDNRSHPTDVNTTLPVPEDMPLTNGKITCITCHYVHPIEGEKFEQRHSFLRGNVTGEFFCGTCHEITKMGLLAVKQAHPGSFKITEPHGSLDNMSLGCIECHDSYYKDKMDSIGAGIWRHRNELTHPVGVRYTEVSMKKMNKFRPAGMLRKEVPLFDGRIGCGTCHSIFSKNRAKLILDNPGSKLCRECHLE